MDDVSETGRVREDQHPDRQRKSEKQMTKRERLVIREKRAKRATKWKIKP